MAEPQPQRRLARPERIRVTLRDDDAGATPLALPPRRGMRVMGLVFAVFFAIFAAIAWAQVSNLNLRGVRDVFDLAFALFSLFWVLGWSVGVFVLGAITVLLLFYGESASIAPGKLLRTARMGPLRIISEYELARMRNLRLETAGSIDTVRIRFDYGAGSSRLGDTMPRADAEALIATLRGAAPATITQPPEPAPPARDSAPSRMPPPPAMITSGPQSPLPALALAGANLVPVAGVLLHGWDLATVMVLFWAESAVIGFYTLLKMAVVGKWAVLLAGPFFAGHYGGFMAVHFLFVYAMFVRGLDASGPEPGARSALLDLFVPLWPALAALFASHGVSFAINFVARREFEGETVKGLMQAPYRRIIVMHVTLIFGGWLLLALKTPTPALVLLIGIKLAADIAAHRREHAARPVARSPR